MDSLPIVPEAFGITRLAEQGTLLPASVPVWCAVRPVARSFAVTNGKGRTHSRARLGAAMEAVECACAEASERLIVRWATLRELDAEGATVIDFQSVLTVQNTDLDPFRKRGFVHGIETSSGAEVLTPYELVGLDYRVNADWDRESFLMSSGGLAAHVDVTAAKIHGLQELIEQEARLFLVSIPGYAKNRPRLDPEKLLPEHSYGLFRNLAKHGTRIELIDITTDVGVPVIMAILHEAHNATAMKRHAAGCACRMNISEAAEAALLEALQSRVTDIAGSRDDIVPDDFAKLTVRPQSHGMQTPSIQEAAYDDPLDILISRLSHIGLEQIYCFDLSPLDRSIICLKHLVPGLECVVEGRGTPRRGRRFKVRALKSMLV